MRFHLLLLLIVGALCLRLGHAADSWPDGSPLPGTELLTWDGDLAERMVAGADRFLLNQLEKSISTRAAYWKRDGSSAEAYVSSVEPNRQRFAKIVGLRDARVPITDMEVVATLSRPAIMAQSDRYKIINVRWPVLPGVNGEGLLLEPNQPAAASVVVIPDCEQTPEELAGVRDGLPAEHQIARRLCESGCRVIVPTLINRQHELSAIVDGKRKSTVNHRELLYRPAYEMGRHLIGYEVQKVLACVDWFSKSNLPIGVTGYGEGGLIALYAGAIDRRIAVTGVSGYFDSRQSIWRQPIDRNVFGLLREFGDAEIASLIAPRRLAVEACAVPTVVIPPGGQSAPAECHTPALESVRAECDRAQQLTARIDPSWLSLQYSGDGAGPAFTAEFMELFLKQFGDFRLSPNGSSIVASSINNQAAERHARQFRELSDFNQGLVEDSPRIRAEFMKNVERSAGVEKFVESMRPYRDQFRKEIIGEFDQSLLAANPRSRLAYDTPQFRGYEVVLDVFPELFLYGILLVPKDLKPDERRPVVVCQHGLEGRAQHTVEGDYTSYRGFAARLAEQGFITFAPQHLYRGGDQFRTLQRKANPLGKTLFSLMTAQHRQLLAWLGGLPFVDEKRIAFYGISYGGKSAMRIPAVLDGYCLSICSSDFSNWIWRTVSNRFEFGYLAHSEYEIFEFDLGSQFNYAELAAMICPRPFAVERLHHHGIAADYDVAEYGRVQLVYENLGLSDRTRMTYFGKFQPPEPYGERETFQFLREQLNWRR